LYHIAAFFAKNAWINYKFVCSASLSLNTVQSAQRPIFTTAARIILRRMRLLKAATDSDARMQFSINP